MKKIATTTLVGLAAVVLAAADLTAQTCNGTASFSAGNMRAGFGIRLPDGGTIFDGELAIGSSTGIFGGGTLAIYDPSGDVEGATEFGGFIGKTLAFNANKTIEMCPQAFLRIGEQSTNAFGGGVTFGRNFKQSTFDLIPTGGAFLSRVDYGTASEIELDLTIGAGFVFNQWTIRPSIGLPLTNSDFRDSALGIMAFYNFGK